MGRVLLSIPSPPANGFDVGGFTIRLYGVMIAIGVLVGLEVARRRWLARGGDPEDMSTVALLTVPAGLIGARIYHVVTDNQQYRGHWLDNPFGDGRSPLAFWEGGLGIPGGLAMAFLVGIFVFRAKGMRLGPAMDAAAPAVPLAQAIGRLGNYFNQELYGGPSDVPWAVQIDPDIVARDNPDFAILGYTTFHPTFLYEGLWNLGLMGVLLWVDKRRPLRPGRLAILYVGGYALGRLWVESIRSDTANTIFGLRVNTWVSLLAVLAVVAALVIGGFRRRPDDNNEPYLDGHRYDPSAPAGDPGEPPAGDGPEGTAGEAPVEATVAAGEEGDADDSEGKAQ